MEFLCGKAFIQRKFEVHQYTNNVSLSASHARRQAFDI